MLKLVIPKGSLEQQTLVAKLARQLGGAGRPQRRLCLLHIGLRLPQINIDGVTGTELATALGTVLTFDRGGVSYIVIGSVPPAAAENAARGLK